MGLGAGFRAQGLNEFRVRGSRAQGLYGFMA